MSEEKPKWKEWCIFDLNTEHFEFNFNQKGKFYFVCEKDKYFDGFKLLFTDLEQSHYMPQRAKEIYGKIIIGEYEKGEIKQFLERGTALGDCFDYNLFHFFFEDEKKAYKKCKEILLKNGFEQHGEYKYVFHKNFKIFYIFEETGTRNLRRNEIIKTIKKKNSEERFNPICCTQLLNELKEKYIEE